MSGRSAIPKKGNHSSDRRAWPTTRMYMRTVQAVTKIKDLARAMVSSPADDLKDRAAIRRALVLASLPDALQQPSRRAKRKVTTQCAALVCLSFLLLALGPVGSLAQPRGGSPLPAPIFNPSTPYTLPAPSEVPVSPATPSGLTGTPSTNPLAGCTAEGSLAVGAIGPIPGTIPLPETGEPSEQLQAPPSVFGTQGAPGPC
jgi:hypothetical protein